MVWLNGIISSFEVKECMQPPDRNPKAFQFFFDNQRLQKGFEAS